MWQLTVAHRWDSMNSDSSRNWGQRKWSACSWNALTWPLLMKTVGVFGLAAELKVEFYSCVQGKASECAPRWTDPKTSAKKSLNHRYQILSCSSSKLYCQCPLKQTATIPWWMAVTLWPEQAEWALLRVRGGDPSTVSIHETQLRWVGCS